MVFSAFLLTETWSGWINSDECSQQWAESSCVHSKSSLWLSSLRAVITEDQKYRFELLNSFSSDCVSEPTFDDIITDVTLRPSCGRQNRCMIPWSNREMAFSGTMIGGYWPHCLRGEESCLLKSWLFLHNAFCLSFWWFSNYIKYFNHNFITFSHV